MLTARAGGAERLGAEAQGHHSTLFHDANVAGREGPMRDAGEWGVDAFVVISRCRKAGVLGCKPQFPSPPAAAHALDAPLFTPEQKPHVGCFTINAIPLVTPRSHQCSPKMELSWLINALV